MRTGAIDDGFKFSITEEIEIFACGAIELQRAVDFLKRFSGIDDSRPRVLHESDLLYLSGI